jgi:hypothetical protein
MLKRVVRLLVEVVLGVSAAGVLLAAIVPVMVRQQMITPGDRRGALVIGAVLMLTLGTALFRPGSALRGRRKPNS